MCGSRPALFFAGEERVHPAENKEAGGLDTLVAGVDVRRMRTRKTTEIELETQEMVLAAVGATPMVAWCPKCAGEVAMDSPEKAARLAGVTVRAIYRWVETGEIHFTEAPHNAPLICLASLFEIAPRLGPRPRRS